MVGLVAALGHLLMAGYARGDLTAWRQGGGDLRGVIAGRWNIRRELGNAAAQLCLVGVGLCAMTLPVRGDAPPTASLISGLLIVAAELLLLANSLLNHRDRRALLAYLGGRRRTDQED